MAQVNDFLGRPAIRIHGRGHELVDPHGEAHGAVCHADSELQRPRLLDQPVPRELGLECLDVVDVCRLVRCGLVVCESCQIGGVGLHGPEIVQHRYHGFGLAVCLVSQYDATPVPSLDDILRVAQRVHQFVERMSHLVWAKSRLGWCRREAKAKARECWRHNVEGRHRAVWQVVEIVHDPSNFKE